MKGKHLLIGIVVLAVVAAIFISLDDSFPPEFARGTIGVADTVVGGVEMASRYRTEQINAGDVQLGNTEVQMLLQNDAFIAMIQDPKFARAIEAFSELEKAVQDNVHNKAIEGEGGPNDVPAGGSVLDALEDQKIMSAIKDGTSRDALWDDDVKRLIVSPLWSAMIKDQNVRDYIGSVAVKGGETSSDNEFKTKRGGETNADNEFKTKRGGETNADNEFKALEGGETNADNEFKALEGGETNADNEFKALEGGETNADNNFQALEGGETNADNNFQALEGGETNADNNFKALEGGETNADNTFATVADDVREVLESDNFKKSVQDHPGFWRQIADDPGFAKAIQDNFETIEAFGKIPAPVFGKAIAAVSEGFDIIRGSGSTIGDLAKTPEPVFGLVAQDPGFEAIREGSYRTSDNDQ